MISSVSLVAKVSLVSIVSLLSCKVFTCSAEVSLLSLVSLVSLVAKVSLVELCQFHFYRYPSELTILLGPSTFFFLTLAFCLIEIKPDNDKIQNSPKKALRKNYCFYGNVLFTV